MLSVRALRRLGDFTLDVDFVARREILVLFGPSGAGKTQTLDLIAGLATPDSGSIRLDETTFFQRDGNGTVVLPPRDRRVGYVVQQYALFPHLTALQNVAYGLPDDAVPDTALQLMRKLRIDHAATRRPADLSGGEQQRVAIARALAIRPRVLLLDEPFAALDAQVRMQLHAAIRELQQELDLVVVYVTHNLDDAFSIGQRLAIIDDGKIQQIGSFEEVTSRPANDVVLRILGVRNPISGTVVESRSDAVVVDWSGVRLEAMPAKHEAGDAVRGYIRGEDVKVIQEGLPRREALEKNNIRARLVTMQRGPWYNTLTFAMVENGRHIEISAVRESHAGRLQPGEEVTLAIKPKAIVVF